MKSFTDYLKSNDYFTKLNARMNRVISETLNEDDEESEDANTEELDKLTDTEDIDSEVDDAQKKASKDKAEDEESEDADTEEDTEETPEESEEETDGEDPDNQELSDKDKKIEKQTFKQVLDSDFFKDLQHACRCFVRISNNKDYGFEIPRDKRTISFKPLKLVMCGYQISFADFENEPVKSDINNFKKIHMVDSISVACINSDYYGINFFNRTDFVITDTNADSYAEKLFNTVINELKSTSKLTYDCLKAAVLNKMKSSQNISDDVLIGYMRVYNFANYVSKEIIDKYYISNKIPIIVSDASNLVIDDLKKQK